jgi:hypothetical protein
MTGATKCVTEGVNNTEAWNRQRILTLGINIVFTIYSSNRPPQHKAEEHLNTYTIIIQLTL